VVGAEGTRAGKNLHAAVSMLFNSARRGKEMEGRALVRVWPSLGRRGSSAVCGACQEEGWGSGWHQTRERDGGGGLSVKQGTGGGGGCMGRCGDRGSVQGKERENALGPKKIVQFSNYLNIFKMTRIDLIKRWSS
jgi:hypothetical protein